MLGGSQLFAYEDLYALISGSRNMICSTSNQQAQIARLLVVQHVTLTGFLYAASYFACYKFVSLNLVPHNNSLSPSVAYNNY